MSHSERHDRQGLNSPTPVAEASGKGTLLHGIGASPGIALGPALVHRPGASDTSAASVVAGEVTDTDTEHSRLHTALAAAATELRALAEQVRHDVGGSAGDIFEAQAMMLEDPTISERADGLIDDERRDASSALQQAIAEQAALLAAMSDPLWQARAADIQDAGRRAASHLLPASERPQTLAEQLAALAHPVIVVARDLVPSETAAMRPDRVLGVALAEGNTTSHAAILARALGIPAVVGMGAAALESVQEGETLILDVSQRSQGIIILHPSADEIAQARQAAAQYTAGVQAQQSRTAQSRSSPGHTRDGHHVALLANVGSVADAQAAAEMGAEGIGLLRTEFLFAQHATLPDVDEQAAIYGEIIAALGQHGKSVTIRTLDAGTDKPLDAVASYTAQLPAEVNAALGVRGIRLHHCFPELLSAQFQAILLAATRTKVRLKIMLPMVDTVAELREAKTLFQAARDATSAQGAANGHIPPLGIMVETPAAVLMADALAREAAFFSLGTNDLTQYVMAADRLNAELAYLSHATEPAVIRAISLTARSAAAGRRSVSVCGEMAADPRLALLLVGLGIGELSMTPASIPLVKQALATHTQAELRDVGTSVLRAETRADVEEIMGQLAIE